MKKPEIKSYMISAFLDQRNIKDINLWEPDDKQDFEFWMQVSIGIKGQQGADDFSVHIVSQNMMSQIDKKQHLLVVPYFESVPKVIELINRSIADCTGSSWADIAACISKMYHWEYANYKE